MSYTAHHPALVSRRRRWPLVLIAAIVVLLIAGWTALWFYAAARARTEIAAWREREFQAGRFYDCASELIGGFPFRIEWRCAGARLEFQGTPMLELKLPVILAAVQLYDPTLLISEFTGPQLEPRSGQRARPAELARTRIARARRSDRPRSPPGRQRHDLSRAARRAAWPARFRLHARQSDGRGRSEGRCRGRSPPSSGHDQADRCRHRRGHGWQHLSLRHVHPHPEGRARSCQDACLRDS